MPSTPAFQRLSRYLAALPRNPLLRNGLAGALFLIVLYGVFGYFVLPGIVQSQAQKFVAEKYHRVLTIDKVEIHPFTLLASIRGLKLMEPQGNAVFVGFDTLTVKMSPQSLLHLAPIVQEVLLDEPTVHLVRRDAHHYNFDDLLAPASPPAPSPPPSLQPARFAVYNIQIQGGRIEFDDQPVGAHNVVSDLQIGVPFISSLPSDVEVFVEPLLRAKVNGAALQFDGKARPFAEPKEATLGLNLENVDLTRYLDYLPYEPHFKLPSARLDLHLSATFRQPQDKAPTITLGGTVALKSLKLTELNGKPVLDLPELALTLGKSDVLGDRFAVSKVLLKGMVANLTREHDGQLNLQRLLQPGRATVRTAAQTAVSAPAPAANVQSAATAPSKPAALQLAMDDLEIGDATVHFTDQQASRPTHADMEKFDLSVHHALVETGKGIVTVDEVASPSANFLLNLGKPPAMAATTMPPPKSHPSHTSHPQPSSSAKAQTAIQTPPPYTVSIAKIAIDDWSARIEDNSLKQPMVTTIGPLSLHLQNLSTAPATLAQMDLKALVNKHGQLTIGGKVGLSPLHTDLTLNLNAIDLLGLQPYVTDQVNLLVSSASLSAKGVLKLDKGETDGLRGGFKGNLTLANVATVDKLSADDFLSWKLLSFGGVNVQLAPMMVNIDQIALHDFFARVIIEPDGHINLQDIARHNPGDSTSLTESHASRTAKPTTSAVAMAAPSGNPTTAPTPSPALPIKIGKILLQGGKVRYTDNVIRPHYTANLMDLGGTIAGLSSAANSRANVDLHGQVNGAPLTIGGVVNPLRGDLALDIKANVHGMELAPLSPYSGRYVGYGIEKGKLSFEVAYQIEQRKLTAENRLILDQLTFGDKIDSPVATKLPVLFAVSLLKDRDGVIDINLPISGSLDAPDFSVGGVIVKVVVNLVTKAVTEPFALLGSLFGGGEELSTIAFDSGSYAIAPAGENKLKALATALTERPALKLEIGGVTDPDGDRVSLQQAALRHKLQAIKLKERITHGAADTTDANVDVTPAEYPGLLAQAYKAEKFAKPRNALGMEKSLPTADMEKLMLANITIGNDDLTALGNRRALAVKDWLMNNGKVSADRLYIVASKSTAQEVGKTISGRVDFNLR